MYRILPSIFLNQDLWFSLLQILYLTFVQGAVIHGAVINKLFFPVHSNSFIGSDGKNVLAKIVKIRQNNVVRKFLTKLVWRILSARIP